MKSSILFAISMLLIGLLVVPALVYAETDEAVADNPPVSQPLVREGTVALKLVDALHLAVSSEAEAESVLGAIGIAPSNGWIADYPVTPDILVELQTAVLAAADSGRIAMSRDEASKAFQDVMQAYNLSVEPSAGGQTAGNEPVYQPDQTIINNYYYDEGPPVVTYYAPPPDYAYLYTWVPYPFWWWDFWFPGFYVLADFDVHLHGHFRDHDRGRHFRDWDRDHFSNHFRNHKTGKVSRIDPAHRAHGGIFADRKSFGWKSSAAQSGARAIFERRTGRSVKYGNSNVTRYGWRGRAVSPSVNRSKVAGIPTFQPRIGTVVPRRSNVQGEAGGASSFRIRPSSSGRTITAPSVGSRTYDSYRSNVFGSAGNAETSQPRNGSIDVGRWRGSTGSPGSFGGWRDGGGSGGIHSSGGWHIGGGRSFGGWHGGRR